MTGLSSAGPGGTVSGIDLSAVQRRRKLVLLIGIVAAALLMLFMAPVVRDGTLLHYAMKGVGAALILLCILGRTWTALYISGIKRVTLVATGPYSIVRNPLYVFSVIGAAGAGLWTGSVSTGIVLSAITFGIFHVVILSEEQFLREKFGAEFAAFAADVPRWLPALGKWRGAEWVTIRPTLVTTTFVESSCFLLVIPVIEGIGYLQGAGLLPVLFRLV
jgi:protein-S-isoprenylcysteine O-methyltransferase Ste14